MTPKHQLSKPTITKHALWLMPQSADASLIQPQMDHYSNQFGLVSFSAHLTLCSPIEANQPLPCQWITALKACLPVKAKVLGVRSKNHYYQRFFLDIERNKTLDLCWQTAQTNRSDDISEWHPHISLLYDHCNQHLSHTLFESVIFTEQIVFDRIALVNVSGETPEWEIIETIA